MFETSVQWTHDISIRNGTSGKGKNESAGNPIGSPNESKSKAVKKDVISALDFNHDGTQIAICTGKRISLHDCQSGKLLKQFKGHKDVVYTVSISKVRKGQLTRTNVSNADADGLNDDDDDYDDYDEWNMRMASGGADNNTILWDLDPNQDKDKYGRGMLKFTHESSVQRVLYNPVIPHFLASCSCKDFGLYQEEISASALGKTVQKYAVESNIISASWSNHGQMLVLGLQSGQISCHNLDGRCISSFQRSAPIMDMVSIRAQNNFVSNSGTDVVDMLAVVSWDRMLSIYNLSDKQDREIDASQQEHEQQLDYFPCSVSSFVDGGGMGGTFVLVAGSKEGIDAFNVQCVHVATFLYDIASPKGFRGDILTGIWCIKASERSMHTSDSMISVASVNKSGMLSLMQLENDPIMSVSTPSTSSKSPESSKKKNDIIAYRNQGTNVILHMMFNDVQFQQTIVFSKCIRDINVTREGDCVVILTVTGQISIYQRTTGDTVPETMNQYILTNSTIVENCEKIVILSSSRVVTMDGESLVLREFLEPIDHEGPKRCSLIHEWKMNAIISCASILSHAGNSEALLVGGVDGRLMKVVLNAGSQTIEMIKLQEGIQSISIDASSRYIGLLDRASQFHIYDLDTESLLDQPRTNVKNVYFHDTVGGLYCCLQKSVLSRNLKRGATESCLKICHGKSSVNSVNSKEGCAIVRFSGSDLISFDDGGGVMMMLRKPVDLTTLVEEKACKGDFNTALEIAKLGVSDTQWTSLWKKSLLSLNFDTALRCNIDVSRLEMSKRLKDMSATLSPLKREDITTLIEAELGVIDGRFEEACEKFLSISMTERATQVYCTLNRFDEARSLLQDSNESTEDGLHYIIFREAEWEKGRQNFDRSADLFFQCGEYTRAIQVCGDKKRVGWVERIVHFGEQLPGDERQALELCCDYLANQEGNEHLIKDILIKLRDMSRLAALYIKMKAWIEVGHLIRKHKQSIDKSLLGPYADWLIVQGNIKEALEVNSGVESDRNANLLSFLIRDSCDQECYGTASYLYYLFSREKELQHNLSQQEEQGLHGVSHMQRLASLFFVFGLVSKDSLFYNYQPRVILQGCVYLLRNISPASSKPPDGISLSVLLNIFICIASKLEAFHSCKVAYQWLLDICDEPAQRKDEIRLELMEQETMPDEDDESLLTMCIRCGSRERVILSKDYSGDRCQACYHPFVRCTNTMDILPLVEFVPDKSLSQEEVLALISAPSSGRVVDTRFHDAINTALADSKDEYIPVAVDKDLLQNLNAYDIFNGKNETYYFNMLPDTGIASCCTCCCFFALEEFEMSLLKDGHCPFCREG